MPRLLRFFLIPILALVGVVWPVWGEGFSYEPAGTGGLAAIDRALARVETHRRVLVVGAHPDDEDTTLLTLVARGMGGEAAYLSLTRGDGGQNLIGPELGEDLGVLRTEELLAARRVDGARQYFTRAYDFGYSKTLEEALTQWPREVLLEDVVRVIRRFRPQVVVSVFPPDARAGHGQHQAAGWATGEAFARAGFPDRFPQLTAEGLPPWEPSLFYRSAWFDREEATLTLPADGIDPLTGRSIYQLAMESRSQHRCQSFGTLQPIGPHSTALRREVPPPEDGGSEDLFGALETRLRGVAALAPQVRGLSILERVETLVGTIRSDLTPLSLADQENRHEIETRLIDVVRMLRQAHGVSRLESVPHVEAILAEKVSAAETALAATLGLVLDATTDDTELVPGEPTEVTVELWNTRGGVVVLEAPPRLESTAGWLDEPVVTRRDSQPLQSSRASTVSGPAQLESGVLWTGHARVTPSAVSPPSLPYWLRRPRLGALYDWSEVSPRLRGEPTAPAPLTVVAEVRVPARGEPIGLRLEREVVSRRRDLSLGEVRQPLQLAPRLLVSVEPRQLLIPRRGVRMATPAPGLSVRLEARAAVSGTLEVDVPPGWPAVEAHPFELGAGESQAVALSIGLPDPLPSGRFPLVVEAAEAGGGSTHRLGRSRLDYPHVRPRSLPRTARADAVLVDLVLPSLGRVLYVPGADPAVATALAAVGVPIEIVDPTTLAARLRGGESTATTIDAVVIGSRAYESSPELASVNGPLSSWLAAGGLLIVEFQRWDYFEAGLPPYPLELTRRARERTADETAPVRILAGARAGEWPNPMRAEDWEGWVQERGTYYPVGWGDSYTPWLAMADPGEDEALGSILEARVGKGVYLYTGVAFFRQLPAGVPGAFRLFANMLSRAPRGRSAGNGDASP